MGYSEKHFKHEVRREVEVERVLSVYVRVRVCACVCVCVHVCVRVLCDCAVTHPHISHHHICPKKIPHPFGFVVIGAAVTLPRQVEKQML